jgi:hypothetical protein
MVHEQPDKSIDSRFRMLASAQPNHALFTSRVFEGMRGDYFISRNFSDRLFTSPGFEGIISGYLHKSPLL